MSSSGARSVRVVDGMLWYKLAPPDLSAESVNAEDVKTYETNGWDTCWKYFVTDGFLLPGIVAI